MKKKIILVSSLIVLLILSMPFMSTVPAQRDVPVSTVSTRSSVYTPTDCNPLLALIMANGLMAIVSGTASIPLGGTAGWIAAALAGYFGVETYMLAQIYKANCGGIESDSAGQIGSASVEQIGSVSVGCPCSQVSAPVNAR